MLAQAEKARTDERNSRAEAMRAREATTKARTAAELKTKTSLKNEAAANARVVELQQKLDAVVIELAAARSGGARGGTFDAPPGELEQRGVKLEAAAAAARLDLPKARVVLLLQGSYGTRN